MVRFSCPTGLVEIISPMLPDFLRLYPRVNVQIVPIDRPVDLIADRIDVGLRVRVKLETDAALTMRTLAKSRRVLLANPALANTLGTQDIGTLMSTPTLSTSDEIGESAWTLEGPDGATHVHRHTPRFSCSDLIAVRDAAIAGIGIAFLPDHSCAAALKSGALVRVFPDWRSQEGVVHLIFTTRIGLPPQVRAWIDHLAASFPNNSVSA